MRAIQANPTTPGNRHKKYIQKFLLGKNNKLLKALQSSIHRCVGRSSLTGQITLWGRGGGCKKLYRYIHALNTNSLGIILFTTYDPNRSSFISLYFDFLTSKFHYVLAAKDLISGSIIGCSSNVQEFKLGFSCWLANHPNGALFMSLATTKKKPQYALAAGTFCQLLQKSGSICKVRLPSNQILAVSSKCYGTLGTVSNKYNSFIRLGKAGRNRLKGRRPHVRGIAMNPVDHPHGGRTNGGRTWVTPWGKPTQGQKTSKNKKNKN
jgi:large subunit ribosomal protein L2